jgi:hypothetical protein
MGSQVDPLRGIVAMAATTFYNGLAVILSGPDAVANLFEPHVETIARHPVSKRASDEAIQKPDVVPVAEGAGVVPVVFARRHLRKALVDRRSQLFGGDSNVDVDDRRL